MFTMSSIEQHDTSIMGISIDYLTTMNNKYILIYLTVHFSLYLFGLFILVLFDIKNEINETK